LLLLELSSVSVSEPVDNICYRLHWIFFYSFFFLKWECGKLSYENLFLKWCQIICIHVCAHTLTHKYIQLPSLINWLLKLNVDFRELTLKPILNSFLKQQLKKQHMSECQNKQNKPKLHKMIKLIIWLPERLIA
jgi:hypothetical protein